MSQTRAEIRSGSFGIQDKLRDYRAEQLAGILVERIIWREQAPEFHNGVVTTGPGYVWFRFWLPRVDQVVERYYTDAGALLGTRVDLCTRVTVDDSGRHALDLIMDLWIDPSGTVTLHHEDAYEQAVAAHALSDEEAAYAEAHLRSLTMSIAQGRFPPAIVRNWQVDVSRIRADLETAGDPGGNPAGDGPAGDESAGGSAA